MSGFVKGWNATLGKWLGLQLDADNNLLVNPGLLTTFDQIDVAKKSRGTAATPFSARTGTEGSGISAPFSCAGFNTVGIQISITGLTTGSWTVYLLSSIDGTSYGRIRQLNTNTLWNTGALTANGVYPFTLTVPGDNYEIELVAAAPDAGSTITVKTIPMNI